MKKSKMKLNRWRLSRLRATTTITTSPVLMLLLLMMTCVVEASEFPERECCDPIYPMPDPTSRLPNVPSPTGKTGSDKTTAILNCLYARKLCFEHASCSAILEVIPRVCGPELVACSTVTVSKCQAALKSLQAFEFFKPTCLCHEPHVDPECNDFRDFLFDHKCIYVNKKEKDPYSIEALPTCNHALSECQRDKSCVKLYDDFKTNCKTRDGRCRMENRDACTEAWTQLRLSPMFGCICPDNGAKKRCDRIFSMVNHNPCVGVEPYSASLDLAGTDSALYEDQQQQQHQQHPDQQLSVGGPKSRHAYPYFLYPNGTEPKVPPVEPGFYELDQELASSLEEQYWRQQQGYGGQEDERQQEATEQGVGGRLKLFLYQESAARGPPSPELSRSLTAIRAYEAGHWRTRWLYVLISPFASSDDDDKDDNKNNNNDDGNDASQRPTKVTTYYRPRAPKHDLREHSYYLTNSTATNDNNNNSNSTTTLHQSHQHETNNHNNNHHLHNHLHKHHHNNHNQHQHQHRHRPNSHLHHLQPHQSTATKAPSALATALPASGVNGQTTNLELDAASSSSAGSALPIDRLKGLREAFEGFIDSVNVISNSDNTTTLELIESQVQNPLIDADHQDLHELKQLPIPNVPHQHRIVTSSSSSHGHRSKNQSSSSSSAQAAQQHNGGSSDDREDGLAAPSSLPDNNERLLLAQQQPAKVVLSSTCHHAYTACKNDPSCSNLLQPVLSRCDHSSCARNECLSALEHFYKAAAHKHSLEIAFCLCRKSEGKRDECMMAQEKLHPSCALRAPAGQEKPTCNALATSCRQRPSCRAKLEHYEQNCAVDSVTKKCAGPAQGCRTALLGILGTELRTACDCRGTDFAPIYECLGWQRLLWVNPCVAEAQKDFHARRSRHHGHGRSGTSTSGPATIGKTPRTTTTTTSKTTTTTTTQRATWPTVVTPRASLVAATSFESLPEEELEVEEERRHEAEDNNVIPDVPTVRSIEESRRFNKELDTASTTTSTTVTTTPMSSTKAPTTTTTTTTTTPRAPTTPSTTTTSTVPPRFCVYQRPSQSHQQYIREGKGKRFYKDSEPDECSELCQCGEGERLTCNVICVKSSPCKTDFAFYNHAAPAYQAYRGRCLCYSGRFICMRPSPDTYNIPHGVFMFLGYSETDENLLKPLNNLTVVDAVVSLDNFMREEVNNQTICTLFLYNITKENVIAAARLTNDNALQQANVSEEENLRHLMRVKEECATMLQELSEKINNRHQEVHSHPLLSIFKMAEVEIKLPRTSSGSASPVVDTSWWYSSMLGCAAALLLCTSASASS